MTRPTPGVSPPASPANDAPRFIIPDGILRGLEIVCDPTLPDDVLEVDAPDGRTVLRVEGIGPAGAGREPR